jgi:hypothetical protein
VAEACVEVSAVMLVARSSSITHSSISVSSFLIQTFGTREWIRDVTIGSSVSGLAVGLNFLLFVVISTQDVAGVLLFARVRLVPHVKIVIILSV